MKLKVTINGEQYELILKPDYNLLAVIRRNRLNPPFSCTEGRCGKCKAKLISGLVNQLPGTGLGLEDRKKGYILTCRSTGDSEVIEIEF